MGRPRQSDLTERGLRDSRPRVVRQPSIAIRLESSSPQQPIRVGEQVTYEATITNTGSVDLTGLQLVIQYQGGIVIRSATDKYQIDQPGHRIFWNNIPTLPAQQFNQFQIRIEPDGTTNQARLIAMVQAEQRVNAQDIKDLSISERSISPSDSILPQGTPQPSAGRGPIGIQIIPTLTTAIAGQSVRYTINMKNLQNVEERNIQLQVSVPQGARNAQLNPTTGVVLDSSISLDGQSIVTNPIQFFRSGEEFSWQFIFTPLSPGPASFSARALRDNQQIGDVVQTSINVSGR